MTLPKLPRHLIPLSGLTLLMAAVSSPLAHDHRHPAPHCEGACAVFAAVNTATAIEYATDLQGHPKRAFSVDAAGAVTGP